tara:strand:+ start:3873 stop:4031 length:159 start_codon:yes stop_codon:yes gene_type:complete
MTRIIQDQKIILSIVCPYVGEDMMVEIELWATVVLDTLHAAVVAEAQSKYGT